MGKEHEPGTWQWARAEAFRLAPSIGARVGQSEDGATKTVAVGGRVHQCATWLAVYTVIAGIAADRGPKAQAPAVSPAGPRVVDSANGGMRPAWLVPPVRPPTATIPVAVVPTGADFVGLMVCVRGGRLVGRHVHVLSVRADGLLAVQCDDDGSAWAIPVSRLTGGA